MYRTNIEQIEKTKKIIKKFPRRHILMNGLDYTWSCDLADFSKNKIQNKYSYVLFLIDNMSKYLFISFLKNKTSKSIIDGIKDVFNQTDRRPKKIMSDMESGLYSKETTNFLKAQNIILYHTFTGADELGSHNPIVDSAIKNIKHWTSRYYNENDMYNSLINCVELYNNSFHSTIKMAPADAIKPENYEKLEQVFNIRERKYNPKEWFSFQVGDNVRIYKLKGKFEKGYTANWTDEIFKIAFILETKPKAYILADKNNELIKGKFYAQQLAKSVFLF